MLACVRLFVQLERSYQRFTAFYASRHSGRKLTWLYHLSKGELVANCFKNRYVPPLPRPPSRVRHDAPLCPRYTLQASTFQMAILLQYNTEDSYSVQQLSDSTQIKTVRPHTCAPLCCSHGGVGRIKFVSLFDGKAKWDAACVSSLFPAPFQEILIQVLQILLKSKLLVSRACAPATLAPGSRASVFPAGSGGREC